MEKFKDSLEANFDDKNDADRDDHDGVDDGDQLVIAVDRLWGGGHFLILLHRSRRTRNTTPH